MDKIRLSVESKWTQWTPEHLQDIAQRIADWRNPIPIPTDITPLKKRQQGILCFDDMPHHRKIFYAAVDYIRDRGEYPTYDALTALTGLTRGQVISAVVSLSRNGFAELTLSEIGPKSADDDVVKVRALRCRNLETDEDRARVRQARDLRWVFSKRKSGANTRAKKLGVKGRTRTHELIQMQRSQKNKCWWCGRDLAAVHHVDHRVPLHKGGTNDTGNLCLSCPDCNLKKHDKMPWEFCGRLL